MKFSVVIGNPPFQSSANVVDSVYVSLWTRFWSKAFSLVESKGVVSLITPTTWMAPTGDLKRQEEVNGHDRLWNVFSDYTSVADVDSVEKHFPGVGSSFGRVLVDTEGTDGLSFTNGFPTFLGFCPHSGMVDVLEQLCLSENIGKYYKQTSGKSPATEFRVSYVKSRSVREETIEVHSRGMPEIVDGCEASLLFHIGCHSQQEGEYLRNRMLESNSVINKHCRYNGFHNLRVVDLIKIDPSRVEQSKTDINRFL